MIQGEGIQVKYRKTATLFAGAMLAMGMAAPAFADTGATGAAADSPGVLSGNVIQVPVHVPLNACGNSIGLIALLNPAMGNACVNG
ncbi:chaplin [Streptomyces sp. NPDC057445]|uniref:chaplin n=1 Tax=Streptomyces sp. NPDC057445 TaxID=3346136 RepID=UPI00368F8DD8